MPARADAPISLARALSASHSKLRFHLFGYSRERDLVGMQRDAMGDS